MNPLRLIFLSFFTLSTILPAFCEDQKSPPKIIALKAAHLFDGVSGKLAEPGVVIVEEDKIQAVGTHLEIPKGAEIIDLGDATLMPGMIDSHVHLNYDFNEDFYQGFYKGMMAPATEQILHGVRNAKITLESGFTTVRDLGSDDQMAASLRNGVSEGLIPGPRILASNSAIGATAGHADGPPFPPTRIPPHTPLQGICTGADACREAVRLQIKYGADVIKFMPSGGVLSLADSVDAVQLTQEEMNAIVSEAHTLGRKVAAHCHGDTAAKMAIKAGTDSIEHGCFLKDDTLSEMKKKGVYLVPTLFATDWLQTNAKKYPPSIQKKIFQAASQHKTMFQNAVKIGVKIAFGTDAAVEPHGKNAHEFSLMTKNGLSPAHALMAATANASHLLGIDAETGTLVVGKAADIIALQGNPIADIHATEHPVLVMKGGKIFKLERLGLVTQ